MSIKINQSKIVATVVGLWIFLIPTNLFLKFGENQAYVHGLLVDYLLPKFYLSDVVTLGLLIIVGLAQIKKGLPKLTQWMIGFLLLTLVIGVRQIWTPYPFAAGWMYGRIVLLGLLAISLNRQLLIDKQKVIFWSLFATITFQTIVAGYQFYFQKSLAGYYFLGEPNLSRSFGISQGVFGGAERILSYGTTAHPNILAGAVVLYTWILWLLFRQVKTKTNRHYWVVVLSTTASLFVCFITQSLAASCLIVTGLAALSLFNQKLNRKIVFMLGGSILAGLIIVPLALNYLSTFDSNLTSIERRIYLNQASLKMIMAQPLTGIGLHQTTALIESYSSNPEVVRFVQPIHHVGLLWLVETGMIGMAWLILVLTNRNALTRLLMIGFILLPVLTTDHYFLTLASGQLLLVLVIWCSSLLNIDKSLS